MALVLRVKKRWMSKREKMAVLRQIMWISVILIAISQRTNHVVTTYADRTSEYGAVGILFAPEFKASAPVMLNVLTVSQR